MKRILITGARSGIARHIIDLIKDRDYYIYATCHTELESIRLRDIYKENHNIECFKLDINDAIDRAKIDSITVDIFISNAAVSYGGNLLELDMEKIKEVYDTNIFNNLELIRKVIKKNINRECRIIIMSSIAGMMPIKFIGAYASSKASLTMIGQILASEVKMLNKGIKISIIEPGLYKTGFNRLMFLNKYDNNNSLYQKKIKEIRLQDKVLLLLASKNINRIAKLIVNTMESDNPPLVASRPYIEYLFAKITYIFKN